MFCSQWEYEDQERTEKQERERELEIRMGEKKERGVETLEREQEKGRITGGG